MTAVHRIDRDRRELASRLRKRLARFTREAYTRAVAAVRLGHDPTQAVRSALQPMAGPVARSITLATLSGVRRAALDARRHMGVTTPIMLDRSDEEREEDDRLALALLLLLGWTEKDMAPVSAKARGQAEVYVRRMSGPLLRRVEATKAEWSKAVTTPSPVSSVFYEPPGTDQYIFRGRVKDLRLDWDRAGFGAKYADAWGVRTWANTIATTAYEDGRWRGNGTPVIAEAIWGYRYSAILDSRTTELCRSLDNWIAPKDEPAIKTFAPPNHFRCRSVLVPVWQSSALSTPIRKDPKASADDWVRFLEMKRKFLSYQN